MMKPVIRLLFFACCSDEKSMEATHAWLGKQVEELKQCMHPRCLVAPGQRLGSQCLVTMPPVHVHPVQMPHRQVHT